MNQPDIKPKTGRRYAALGLLVLGGLLFAYYTGDQASSVASSAAFTIDTRDADTEIRGASLLAGEDSAFFTIDTRDPDTVTQANALSAGEDSGYFTIDTRDPDSVTYAVSVAVSEWSGYFTIDTMADSSTRAESGFFAIDTRDPDALTRALSSAASDESAWFTINTLAPPPEDNDADTLHDLWETIHFGSILADGPSDDPDGDGFSNFAEFAFGTDPMGFGGPGHVEFSIEATQTGTRLVLRHGKNILALGMVDYAYEISTDLSAWTDNTTSWSEAAEPQNLSEYVELVTVAYDIGEMPPRIFVRVKVTSTP